MTETTMFDSWQGTFLVARAALRRDRLLVTVWVAMLVLVVYASAAATGSLYESTADRVDAARAINDNPAVVALYGPILDVHSLGELAMTKVTVLYAVILALMFVVIVRRHTRSDEESGHAELLAGTAIGRDALLAAALVEGVVLSVGVGALVAVADIAGGLPLAGSLGFGATWVGIGLVSVALTALCCQLAASSRTCFGIAGAALAALYLMRAAGDVGAEWLSWLTPFGWNTRLSAWSDPRWWVLLLYVALAGVLAVAAQALRARRDLGSGLFPARPGPAHGSPRLADVLALTWRVHQPALLGWTVGVLALGTVMGAIAPGVRRPARHRFRPEADREHRRHRRARGLTPGGRAVDLGGRHHLLRDRRGRPRERGRARRAYRTGPRHRHLPQPLPAGRAAGRPRWGGVAAARHRVSPPASVSGATSAVWSVQAWPSCPPCGSWWAWRRCCTPSAAAGRSPRGGCSGCSSSSARSGPCSSSPAG